MTVLWDVTSCSLIGTYQRFVRNAATVYQLFAGSCYLHVQVTLIPWRQGRQGNISTTLGYALQSTIKIGPVPAREMYGVLKVQLQPLLTSWIVRSTPRPHYPPGKNHGTHWIEAGEHHRAVWTSWRRDKSPSRAGNRSTIPWTSSAYHTMQWGSQSTFVVAVFGTWRRVQHTQHNTTQQMQFALQSTILHADVTQYTLRGQFYWLFNNTAAAPTAAF
jgi:hypothetical protein